jgi:hypothetical protein
MVPSRSMRPSRSIDADTTCGSRSSLEIVTVTRFRAVNRSRISAKGANVVSGDGDEVVCLLWGHHDFFPPD